MHICPSVVLKSCPPQERLEKIYEVEGLEFFSLWQLCRTCTGEKKRILPDPATMQIQAKVKIQKPM